MQVENRAYGQDINENVWSHIKDINFEVMLADPLLNINIALGNKCVNAERARNDHKVTHSEHNNRAFEESTLFSKLIFIEKARKYIV